MRECLMTKGKVISYCVHDQDKSAYGRSMKATCELQNYYVTRMQNLHDEVLRFVSLLKIRQSMKTQTR
jgi:hypothetical protein